VGLSIGSAEFSADLLNQEIKTTETIRRLSHDAVLWLGTVLDVE